jgi:prevent-host-death family protein
MGVSWLGCAERGLGRVGILKVEWLARVIAGYDRDEDQPDARLTCATARPGSNLASLSQPKFAMSAVNMLDAKSNLSRLVEAVESGAQAEIVIARNGKPAARLVPMATAPAGVRLGVAKGLIVAPDDIDTHNDEVARLFGLMPAATP